MERRQIRDTLGRHHTNMPEVRALREVRKRWRKERRRRKEADRERRAAGEGRCKKGRMD